ncbi:MAG: TIGR04076 family protein [Erysipelotrichales bacterium]|nr:TIGR04076 family protein [Erysipelotrichales bacterium]
MCKVKLTITESKCRCGYFRKGDEFIVEDLCPPLCHELWNGIYPLVYALKNGAELDYGNTRSKQFDAKCPDGGRVEIHGEAIE